MINFDGYSDYIELNDKDFLFSGDFTLEIDFTIDCLINFPNFGEII